MAQTLPRWFPRLFTPARDFSSPVTYTVTAEDGSTAAYAVTATAALNPSKEISGFSFTDPAATGVINGNSISVTVPYGTNLTALVPAIIHTGAGISPASGTARDFSSPVTYTVTAEDGSTAAYTVTVTAEHQGSGAITLIYPRDEAADALSGGNITVSKPGGTENLAASGVFDTYRWRVDGAVRGSADTFTLNAGDYTTGVHQLSLEVTLDGVIYSKSGAFTVQAQ